VTRPILILKGFVHLFPFFLTRSDPSDIGFNATRFRMLFFSFFPFLEIGPLRSRMMADSPNLQHRICQFIYFVFDLFQNIILALQDFVKKNNKKKQFDATNLSLGFNLPPSIKRGFQDLVLLPPLHYSIAKGILGLPTDESL